MDLKNLIDPLRQHYEKIILTLALLGLGAAVLLLMKFSETEKEKINQYENRVRRAQGALVKPVDLTNLVNAVNLAQNPPGLEFDGTHKLFNPVKWQRAADGRFIKNTRGTEGTLDEVQIVRINPLMFSVAVDRWAGQGYTIFTTNEAAFPKSTRAAYSVNETNKPVLILRQVRGAPENPSELIVELKDSGEVVLLVPGKPFVRTNAYEVDLKYSIENRDFKRQRVNQVLKIGGEDYKIVAINPNEVVMSAANDKKYTLRQKPAQ